MGYSKDKILDDCRTAFKDIKTFYNQRFVNYNGKTNDTKEYYTEVVAEFLCENITAFKQSIEKIKITRKESYNTESHVNVIIKDTNRKEENIAKEMFNQSKSGFNYDYIGKIIDYQTPLKNKGSDIAGKIDLLSYDGETLYILELKKPDSKESMLRCVLEGFTYMKTVNIDKLIKNFNLPSDTKIKASPFVFKNYVSKNFVLEKTVQYKQMQENRPHLFRLMNLLDSKPYYITKENDLYKVED